MFAIFGADFQEPDSCVDTVFLTDLTSVNGFVHTNKKIYDRSTGRNMHLR